MTYSCLSLNKRKRVYYFEYVCLSVCWPICRASVGPEPLTTLFDTDVATAGELITSFMSRDKRSNSNFCSFYPISVVRFLWPYVTWYIEFDIGVDTFH